MPNGSPALRPADPRRGFALYAFTLLCGCATHRVPLLPPANPGLPATMLEYSLVRTRQGTPDSVGYWGTYQTDTGDATVRVRIAEAGRLADDRQLHEILEGTAEQLTRSGGVAGAKTVVWGRWEERADSIHTVLAESSPGKQALAIAHFRSAVWQFFGEAGDSSRAKADLRSFVSAYLDALVMAGLAGARTPPR